MITTIFKMIRRMSIRGLCFYKPLYFSAVLYSADESAQSLSILYSQFIFDDLYYSSLFSSSQMKIFIRIYISNNIFLFLFFIMSLDIDKDGSGTIDFSDFLDMMTSKMSERDSREEILKAFRLFDDDETG